MVTWILVADSTKAKIISFEKSNHRRHPQNPDYPQFDYQIIQQFSSERDIGHFSTDTDEEAETTSAVLSSTSAILMNEAPDIARFIQAISLYLERSAVDRNFSRLIFIAPKEVLGLISASITPRVQDLLEMELEMQLVDEDPETLRSLLPTYL